MTADFNSSEWTDQEVGFAVAREVPVIAVNLGRVPYGFIGKFQALPGPWEGLAEALVRVLIKHELMFAAYVKALRKSTGWDCSNLLARILPSIENVSEQQIDELVAAHNENGEVRDSFGFQGSYPSRYGRGLIHRLHELGPRRFISNDKHIITLQAQRPETDAA